jgi:hypothetical protein
MLKRWISKFQNKENSLCMLRWNYLIVNLQTGMTRTCCLTPKRQITDSDIEKYGTDVFLNSDYLLERRREMSKGIRHSDCQACWDLEDKGVQSKRSTLESFTHHLKARNLIPENFASGELPKLMKQQKNNLAFLKENSPRMIEINLGNLCDLKCTYCNHYYSSQWTKELLKYNDLPPGEMERVFPKTPTNLEETFWAFLEQCGKSELIQINILGGEPLLYPNMPEILERLADIFKNSSTQPEIGIVTNFNAKKNVFDKFLNSISNAGKVFRIHIQPSIEAVEGRAEYIRQNLSWERFDSNVNQILELRSDLGFNADNFYFSFQPAINTLSLSSLPDFVSYCHQIMLRHKIALGVGANIITQPFSHDPTILTPDFQKYIESSLNIIKEQKIVELQYEYGRHPQIINTWDYFTESLLPSLGKAIGQQDYKYNDKHRQFLHFIERNDSRRGLSFLKTFPEYEHFVEHCRSGSSLTV